MDPVHAKGTLGRLVIRTPVAVARTRPRSDDRRIIVVLGLLGAIVPLSVTAYLPSLPSIAAHFRSPLMLVELSLSAYFLGLAIGQVVCGPLSDWRGRRPVLLAGLGVYLAGSLSCVLAPSIHVLIGARILQGLGASATFAAGCAMVRDLWSGDHAARAMSLVMMVTAFTPLIAPVVGAQISVQLGWRAVFWLMFGFGAVLVALVGWRLPESNVPEQRGGASIRTPFKAYGRVLASRRAWSYLLCGGLSYAAMFAYVTAAPFVYVSYFDVDPRYFGLFLALNASALILGNWLNSRYVVRFGARRLLGIGVATTLVGVVALLVGSYLRVGGLVAVVVSLLIAVGPVGMVGANAVAGLMNLFPRSAGGASALFGVAQYGFGALAGVLVGAFHDGTPLAMALAMAIMASASFLAWIGKVHTHSPAKTRRRNLPV